MEFKNGINASKEQYGKGVKFVNVSDILNNSFLTYENIIGLVDIDSLTLSKYSVEYGDILFQRSSETREEVGTASVYLDKKNKAVFGGFVIRGKKQGNYDPIFLNNLLKSDKARNSMTSRSGGSTRYNIGQETIASVELYFPTISEQEKIGKLLSSLDSKISTQNKIIERLETLILGLINKIFSQEIKFKNFKGKWEIKTLGEVLIKNSTKNKNQRYATVQSVSNKYGFINQEDIFEDRRVASVETSNYYVIEKGYFAYNPSRINVGSLAYKFDEVIAIISPLYISFKANNTFLTDHFLLYWFKTIEFTKQMNTSFEGSVRNTLSYENLTTMYISFPPIEEQEKIAKTLNVINEKIETEKKILKQLEKQKQYLLSNIFV